MNLIPKCLVAAIWSSLIVIPPPVRGAVVTANFNSIADVPVTTANYTATGNTVDLTLAFAPTVGSKLTVVKVTGPDFIQGAFDNLPQAQSVKLTYGGITYPFIANYFGGTGNDLVLQWANNRIFAWGDNSFGQLGIGTTIAGTTPAPVTSSGVLAGKTITSIAESTSHCMALCADGTLAAWGLNTSGQLGNGTTSNTSTPVAVNTSGALSGKTVIAIAAGSTHSLALCADGTLAAWGDNSAGQFGDGTVYSSSVPVAVRATGALTDKSIIAITAGDSHSLALCADGNVAAWGANTYGQLGDGTIVMREVPVNVSTSGALAGRAVTAIAAGASHSLALCADGGVVAWGYNNYSQLGNNGTTNSSVPVPVNTSGVLAARSVAAIAAGVSHNLVICTDGTLVSWGHNGYGQLGRNTSSLVPGAVNVSGILAGKTVAAITAGYYHSLALCTDGSLAAWGNNNYGQLGNGTTTSSMDPVAVATSSLGSGGKFSVLARGRSNHTLALVEAPVSSNSSLLGATLAPGVLDGDFAPTTTSYTARVRHGTSAVTVTPLAAASATLTVNGVALASGATSPPIPLAPGNRTLTIKVTAQDGVSNTTYLISIREDATLAGLTLSSGSLAPAFSPDLAAYVNYVPTAVAAVSVTPRASDITSSIRVNGAVVASDTASPPIDLVAGSNTVNVTVTALDGTTTVYQVSVIRQQPLSYTYNSATAVPVTATSYTATGNTVNLTLNFMPAVGTSLTVVKLTGNGVIEGTYDNLRQWQSIILTYNGLSCPFVANYRGGSGRDLVLEWANTRLMAWGGSSTNVGQLGNGTTVNSSIPTPVDTSGVLAGKCVVRTATGSSHSLALCTDGTLAAWGGNGSHQLGTTSATNSSVPMEVDRSGALSGETVVAISAGYSHSLALCADGTVVAWGNNSYGQLGCGSRGTGSFWSLPVRVDQTGVLAGKSVIAVSAGPNHSLALCSDGTLAAWGYNTNGELGNTSYAPSNVPIAVALSGALAGKTVTAIAAGVMHNLVLCTDGSLVTWGSNTYYQLGTNSPTTPGVPVAVIQSGVLAGKTVTAIAAGNYHNLVLCSNSTLCTWGYNDSGQLGNSMNPSTLPALVTQTGILTGKTVVAISTGVSNSLALCSDGSLASWGNNSNGMLGNNSSTNSSVPVWVATTMLQTGERFTRYDAGSSSGHSVAMVAMPLPPLATTLAASNISNTTATLNGSINAQGTTSTAVFEYGLTAAYGATVVATPAAAAGTTSTAVSATPGDLRPATTYHFRLAATSSFGTVKGADMSFTTTGDALLSGLTMDSGALYPAFAGNLTRYVTTVPYAVTSVTLTPVCALADSTVKVNGVTVVSGTASNPLALAAGNNIITAEVTGAGDTTTQTYTIAVTCLPQTVTYNSAADTPVTATDFAATGAAPAFALNFAPTPGTTLKVANNTGANPIQSVFSNLAQGQAVNLVYDNVIYPFVANYFGGTGNDLVLQWANNRLLGWGDNHYGQLGNTTVSSSIAAVPVDMTGVLAGKTVIALAVGAYHNLALCADNTLAAWGKNVNGQLGNNSTSTSKTPVWVTHTGALAGRTITAVAAGGSHSLALCADGTLAAWGYNSFGQLGNHGTADSSVPVTVNLTGVLAGRTIIAVAAGDTTSFALCADGVVAAWGDNTNGRLGNNSGTSSSVPVLVEQTGVLAGKTVVGLDAGTTFTLARCADGTLATWGVGTYGQLGNNATFHSPVPVLVDRTGVLAGRTVTGIAAGDAHGMVMCSDGKVAAWGNNSAGQLGNNSTTASGVPLLLTQTGVLSGKTITAIATGTNHNLALCADGFLAAWGSNSSYQLGASSSINSSKVPLTVSGTNLATGEVISSVNAGALHNLMLVASPPAPTATTLAATTVIDTGATVSGTVNANGSTTTIAFEYGLTPSYSAISPATPATATGTTATPASAAISGLLPATLYHYRIVAASSGGTITGADMTFTTGILATLANLALDGGTLAPPFSSNTTTYLITVPFAKAAITLTPLVMSPGAAVTVAGVPVAAGAASPAQYLAVGNTVIEITVTAPGGGYARTYSMTVTRLPQTLPFSSATDIPVTAAGFAAAGSLPPMVLNQVPVTGATLTIVRNTAKSPIAGAFTNLAQGQQVWLAYGGIPYPYVANYFGGTGNDLVLQWANTRLMGWGYNASGQLGNNSYSNSSVAVPVNMSGVLAGKAVTAIAAGNSNNLALCMDGTLAAWGYNTHGELGNNSNSNSLVPVAVDMTGALAGKTVTAITAGVYHHLVLCADGTLATWGDNIYGQLGNNNTTGSGVPVLVDRTGVLAGKTIMAIAAGDYSNLVLCADGTLATWGYNYYGQLGNNSSASSGVPVLVSQSGVLAGKTVVAIAAGGYHNLVLCADGTVVTWGSSSYGQLGNNRTTNSSIPVLASQNGVLADKTVTAIAAGENHSLVLCSDGSMAAWGYDSYGQLGNNSSSQSNVPVMVSTSTMQTGECFTAAQSGSDYSLAMVASPPPPLVETLAASAVSDTGATLNASVNAAGNSATIAFEYGPTSAYGSSLTATPASVSGATATAASATTSGLLAGIPYHFRVVAVGPGGSVRGGDMTFTSGTVATLANLTISSGALTPAFISTTMGYLVTVPGTVTNLTLTPVAASENSTISINGATVPSGSAGSPIPLATGENSLSIVVTAPDGVNTLTYTVKVTRQPLASTYNSATDVPLTVNGFAASGNVAPFVLNHVPLAGTCLTVVNNTGVLPIQGHFDNLAQGQTVLLAYGGLTYAFVANYNGGTGNDLVLQWANIRLLAWGNNGSGQLGNSGAPGSSVPGPVDMSGVLAGKTVVTVAEGASFSLALCADGTLAAWGDNSSGQLGINTSTTFTPVLVDQSGALAGKSVAAIAAGDSHCLALCTDGSLAAWGKNDSGQLGNNSTTNSSVPVPVTQAGALAGKTIIAIAAGSYHNLALCADGSLAAWGRNDYGSLGNNSTTPSSVPVLVDRSGVLAGKAIIAIAAGGAHSLALCADGTLAAWGYNSYGQLGIGNTSNRLAPALVIQSGLLAGKRVTAVSCGSNHSLALCANGTVAAWGANSSWQLGNKDIGGSSVSVPVAVALTGVLAGKTVAAIASGANHCLALCTDHSLAAWGANSNGQLGNNSITTTTEPVLVSMSALGSGENIVAAGAGTAFSLAIVATLEAPVAATLAASGVTDATAVLNGSVDARNTSTSVSFEYGLTSSYGITLSGSPATVTGTTSNEVSATVSGLLAGTTYHFRTVATRLGIKLAGGDMTFTTSATATLSDLAVSDGVLSPSFGGTGTVYCLSVPNATGYLTVTPFGTAPTATIRLNGVIMASGTASAPIPLAQGDNTFSISVTSADGINNKTYSLQVTRMVSSITFNSATEVPMTVSEFAAAGVLPAVVLNHTPLPGTALTLVNNTGGNPIRGTFDNLRQGQRLPLTFAGTTYLFVANYFGGSGNDLVLQWASSRLLAWGDNFFGQLGNNTTTQSATPTPVIMSGALAGKTVTEVASGFHHVLALCADGTMAAWGDNSAGQLGNGTTISSKVPVAVNPSGALAGKMVVAIATSGLHSLALCADGTLAEWGKYFTEQAVDHTLPSAVDQSGTLTGKTVTCIAVGDNHSVALCSDGTLVSWGSNDYGQLGSDRPNTSVPALVNRTGVLAGKTVTSVAAGAWHNLALCSDGTLVAWGQNIFGQLGNATNANNSTVPVAVTQTGVLAGKAISAIAGGGYHSLALCADGTLTSWGSDSNGQLGDSTNTNSSVPVAVTQTGQLAGRTITAISCGGYHCLTLCQDGNLATWGRNTSGQLGTTSASNSNVAVAVSTSAFRNGERLTTATAGSVQCFALVASPQPPVVTTLAATGILDTAATLNGNVTPNGMDGTLSFEYGPTRSYGTTVAAAPASVSSSAMNASADADLGNLIPGTTYHYRFTVTTDGVMTPGEDMTFTTSTVATLTDLTIGDGTLVPAFTMNTIRYIATVSFVTSSITVTPRSTQGTAAVTVNGNATPSGTPAGPLSLAVGENAVTIVVAAADGVNTRIYQVTVTRLPAICTFNSATDVPLTAGDFTATGDAPALVLNHEPQPGALLTIVRCSGNRPIVGVFSNLAQGQMVYLKYGGLAYAFVANYHGGTGNDLVLQWANTRLLAWGVNNSGQLGNGRSVNSSIPVPVNSSGVLAGKALLASATGSNHGLALCSDGTLAAWGDNTYGQLGNNANSNSSIAVLVDQSGVLAGKRVVAIATGANHNLALCADGTLAAWGSNDYGELGFGTLKMSTPVPVNQTGVLAGRTIVNIAAGANISLALCSDGSVAAWGSNSSGQLGNNSTVNSTAPVLVNQTGVLAGATITAIAAGGNHNLALCADGTLVAWGSNGYGQLGNNSADNSGVPVRVNLAGVLAGKPVAAIAAGANHSLALCADGTLVAWGYDNNGQLGGDSLMDSYVPVAVNQTDVLASKTITTIAAGSGHSLANNSNGTLAAWGDNTYGQLGNSYTTRSRVPVAVASDASGLRCMMTAAGASHSLALAGSPLPRVLSLPASGVATTGATLNGTVNAAGNDATGSFEYGSTSAYGASIAAAPSLLAGASDTSVSADLSGLPPGTTWHYRAVAATNSGVAVTGADMTFTTPSNNALLAALFLDAGSLAPQFNKTSTSYLATVSNATTAVAVTPTTEHPGASVQVNGVPVSSGDPSAPISLPVGATTITAAVTAEDGITTNAYTITVTRLLPELDDPDHDGLPNLLEYAFGLEAQQSSAVALPHGKLVGGNYVVEFTEPVGVTGITYGAESSASLLPGSWSEVPDSGTDSDHIFSVPVTGGRLFMRLRVTQQ